MDSIIYQHYRPEEASFIDQVFSWIEQVDSTYAPYLTVFLTPRQCRIVLQLVNRQDDIKVKFNGGKIGSESQRALIYPNYYQVQEEDFDLSYLQIDYPIKFGDLSHSKILGAFLALGIERNRLGDIFTNGQVWQVVVDQKMLDYFKQNLVKIDHFGIKLKELDSSQLVDPIDEWEIEVITSSSLRLDSLISSIFHISRQRSKDMIKSGLVKVNFVMAERGDSLLQEDDLVSVRRFGRFQLKQLMGMTKKNNYRIQIKILKVN
ncbi:RNA-binding protein [Facklamia hominis]|uniref:YlmH/Sll1252 family protein n=1 Tax=Facklamia hominis TaxID=178214 RepID=A0AAJ1Q2Y8_9LACT|nr:YlmH/Sll1252 family protein [Facklamia hominis]MDK7186758.1 YlmH/Sll1252 family protein [Facklamia hominis]